MRRSEIKAQIEKSQQEFVEHMRQLKPPQSAAEGVISRNGVFPAQSAAIRRRTIMHKTMMNGPSSLPTKEGLSLSPLRAKFHSRDFDRQPTYRVLYQGVRVD